jgi:6-phosphogluconolactonase
MRVLSLPFGEARIVADAAALSRVAVEEFVRAANEATLDLGRFTVALAGGSTPRAAYKLLAAECAENRHRLAWRDIHVFFGDERHVTPNHPDSNFLMASETLLDRVPIPAANVHRIAGELEADEAAAQYETELRTFFRLSAGVWPCFDLILLGLGVDGHTASLFPGTTALAERQRQVVANWVPKFERHRITLTLPVINAAAHVVFLVSGVDKAAIVHDVLRPGLDSPDHPASLVQPVSGRLLWLLDEAAASQL